MLEAERKIEIEMWPLVFEKSRALGLASGTCVGNTYFSHVYLHCLTKALTKAPYLDFQVHIQYFSIIPTRSECRAER